MVIGVVGELYIGGDGLVIGYYNCCEFIVLKFIFNFFEELKRGKLYKIGDLCCY